jgi:hypothetical protein
MGLDAYVHCDCVEKGRVQVPPLFASALKIDADTGLPYLDTENEPLVLAYSRWRAGRPCPHESFHLVKERLGNISAIGGVRKAMEDHSHDPESEFPILWKQVVHSGFHSGDAIPAQQVAALQKELSRLRGLLNDDAPDYVLGFLNRMDGLVAASLSVGKPIGF